MPPPICPKCRHSAALEGDLWCAGCTGWEAAGRELCAHWDIPGAKVLANDLILNTARLIRALRSLSAGVAVGGGLSGSAGASRARSVRPGSERAETLGRAADRSRESLPRRRPELPTPPPPPAPNKEEPTEEASGDWEGEEEEELEDEEVVVRGAEPKRKAVDRSRSGHRRRESSPRRDRESAGHSRAPRSRSRGRRHSDRDRDRRGKKKNRRAGRNHQRLHRLAEDPNTRVHRKAGPGLLELSSVAQGRQALDRSG